MVYGALIPSRLVLRLSPRRPSVRIPQRGRAVSPPGQAPAAPGMEPLLPSPLLVLAVVADEVLAPQASKGGK